MNSELKKNKKKIILKITGTIVDIGQREHKIRNSKDIRTIHRYGLADKKDKLHIFTTLIPYHVKIDDKVIVTFTENQKKNRAKHLISMKNV